MSEPIKRPVRVGPSKEPDDPYLALYDDDGNTLVSLIDNAREWQSFAVAINNHDNLLAALREAQATLELILDTGENWQETELGAEWAKRDALLRELDGEGT